MSDEDFPAAHSMDTEWYAVDREGNVGRFGTAEAGAAPNSALEFEEDLPTPEEIVRAVQAATGVDYDVEDLVAMQGGPVFDFTWRTQRFETASFSDATSCYNVLMLLTNDRLLTGDQSKALPANRSFWQRLLDRANLPPTYKKVNVERIQNSKHLLGYVYESLPVGTLQRWIQDGLVQKAWVNHDISLARIGVFEYRHGEEFENWISGPYLRERVPRQPIKLDQLPEAIRRLFESTRFDQRSFARDAALDPREVGECASWDPAWVGLDGIVHRDNQDGGGAAP